MKKTDYEKRWKALLASMRCELYLAERNYGVDLQPRKHRDIIEANVARVALLRKLLKEAKEVD